MRPEFFQVKSSGAQSLEASQRFSHPESHSKISNFMIKELFYSHTLNIKRFSLHKKLLNTDAEKFPGLL